MKTIILAGGLGTRLQSAIKDVPKPMADINGKPFLEYLLRYLSKYNICDVVLSVGYKQNIIKEYFKSSYLKINIKYSCETEPLGTGGAIKKALALLKNDLNSKNQKILIINGDTFFDINIDEFKNTSNKLDSDIILSLKQMKNFDRYGAINLEGHKIKSFEEKKMCEVGYINGGIYFIKKKIFDGFNDLSKFSFEDFLKNNLDNKKMHGYISNDSYFIDIGIPCDYDKAKVDFKGLF